MTMGPAGGSIGALLRLCKRGLSSDLLLGVLVQQGADQRDAEQAVLRCLDRGIVKLGPALRLYWHEHTPPPGAP